jgi:hypothetical protein
MDIFDMEQYEEEEGKFINSLDLSNCDLDENYLTEEEKFLDDLLNENLDTLDLIKER